MNTFASSNKTNSLSNVSSVLMGALLLLISSLVLQGCSSSGGGTVVVEDPKGYYDAGFATVMLDDDMTELRFEDLQGMVSGNRFMLTSASQVLLYDGTFTEITGNSYSATVNIYKDGVLLADTATVEGTFVSTSSMEGTLTGVGAGNGSFNLTYSLNNEPATLDILVRVGGWFGYTNGVNDLAITFVEDSTGNTTRERSFSLSFSVLKGCDYDAGSSMTPIPDVNIYEVTMVLGDCTDTNVNGIYTGYAATTSLSDPFLVFAYTNGEYSASGILDRG